MLIHLRNIMIKKGKIHANTDKSKYLYILLKVIKKCLKR